jgi:hypothetical protein
MIAKDYLEKNLVELCDNNSDVYYRPLVWRDKGSEDSVFLVGINPVTPIYKKQITIRDYSELLLHADKFYPYYKSITGGELTRTREAIKCFCDWLSKEKKVNIVETDVIPYPGPRNVSELKQFSKANEGLIKKGKENFFKLLENIKPKVLIIHSQFAAKTVVEIFNNNKWKLTNLSNSKNILEETIGDLQSKSPLFEYEYPDKTIGKIFVCRHFQYYGHGNGPTYVDFKAKILKSL